MEEALSPDNTHTAKVSQKDKGQYSALTHGIQKDGNDNPICKTEKETQMYRTDFGTLWEKARVGWSERTALKQVYYQGWNRPPAQVGCMRQVLRAGALGRPRGMGWGGWQEEGLEWGTHVNPWLIHVNVWQKLLQYCKVISLQLIKIKEKKEGGLNVNYKIKRKIRWNPWFFFNWSIVDLHFGCTANTYTGVYMNHICVYIYPFSDSFLL